MAIKSLPLIYKIRLLTQNKSEFHIAAYLSVQYHQALIALHRAALIAPTISFEAEVASQCADDPSQFRLRRGESICVNSARAIARLTLELADRKINSRLLTAGPPLLACIVIAISLMKNSSSRLQAADLEVRISLYGLKGTGLIYRTASQSLCRLSFGAISQFRTGPTVCRG